MINSIIFTIKLWYSNQFMVLLNLFFKKISHSIITNPKQNILLPISIIFIFAYPSLYSIYINPSLVNLDYNRRFNIIKLSEFDNVEIDLNLKQFNLYYENSLDKKILTSTFHLQNDLINEITSTDYPLNVDLVSPLQYWGNSIVNLENDLSILKTVNLDHPTSKNGLHIYIEDILNGITKKNGVIHSASVTKINLIYDHHNLGGNTTIDFKSILDEHKLHIYEDEMNKYNIQVTQPSTFKTILANITYLVIIIHFLISLTKIQGIRSKFGLFIAYTVQLVLSLLSSTTITVFFFPDFDFNTPELMQGVLIILTISVENMINLVNSICLYDELPTNLRILNTFVKDELNSIYLLTVEILITWFLCDEISFFIFIVICLAVDHFLLVSYFTSVLSVDLRRLELEDLLQKSNLFDSIDKNEKIKFYKLRAYWKFLANEFDFTFPVLGNFKLLVLLFLGFNHLDDSFRNGNIGISNGLIWELLSKYGSELSLSIETFKLFSSRNVSESTIYKINFIYFMEFLTILIFILSVSSIILKTLVHSENLMDEAVEHVQQRDLLNCIELNNGHYLDVLKVYTHDKIPFVISIGLDKRILVWSPISKPFTEPIEIKVSEKTWPISDVVISEKGALIAIFSKNGYIECFERNSRTIIWRCYVREFKFDKPMESFFREKTIPFSRRKTMGKNKVEVQEDDLSFDKAIEFNNKNYELITISSDGKLFMISCLDGSINTQILTTKTLISVKKLSTPRVNDRLVLIQHGSMIVATAVQNKWVLRKLLVQEENYNSGQKLLTPAALSRQSFPSRKSSISSMASIVKYDPVDIGEFEGTVIRTVDFVGMAVIAKDNIAKLIDVQSGTLLKNFNIGQFKEESLKIFHSDPQHCKFCGCTSVSSFTIIYNELDTNLLMMHTFSIDNRAKNNICLRVERDPRETRCLGFDAVNEHQYWLEDADAWELTESNLIIGIKKKHYIDEEIDGGVFNISKDIELFTHNIIKNRRDTKPFPQQELKDHWEIFTMNSKGIVDYYELPNNLKTGLIQGKIQSCMKFGNKSIIITFGNNLKIFYFGEDLIFRDDSVKNALSFVSKRRV